MAAIVRKFRGRLALQGSMIDEAAKKFRANIAGCRDSSTPYHITLVTKEEYRSAGLGEEMPTIAVDHLYCIGLGGCKQSSSCVYWVVCIWPAADAWRKSVGLPKKDFHITLTDNDLHTIAKDASSLLNPEKLALGFPHFTTEKQDHVLHHLHSIRSDLTLPLTISSAIAHPDSARHFKNLLQCIYYEVIC